MAVRFAKIQDVPALVQIGRRMHGLTRFRDQPYSESRVTLALEALIAKGEGKYVFLVAQDSAGRVIGGLIGVLEQQIFSDHLVASVMHYDVLPEARMGGHGVRLLKAFEQWARNRKVREIALGVNSGVDVEKTGKFVERLGYQKVGENFVLACC